MKIEVNSIEGLPQAAARFLEAAADSRIFAFRAPMGAGKTTFIAELCRALGADDDFGSPTFSIVNEYLAKNGESIYHFDFYRLESAEEAADIGAEDYFSSGSRCFIEWPERVEAILPEDTVFVTIDVDETSGKRTVTF